MFEETLRLAAEDLTGGLVLPYAVLAMRLVGAALFSGLIGYERETGDHAAGLRTPMLVGIGAASFALVAIHIVELFGHRPDTIRMDPIRLVEAATAGVAFLAAGMIVLSKGEVKNLTTGAGMWLAAAIGLACGLGLWPLAITATVLGVAVQALGRVTHGS